MQRALLALTLIACGQTPDILPPNETSGVSPKSVPISTAAVASFDQLPRCDDAHLGEIYYIEQHDVFMACRNTGWQQVALNGQNGLNGADGAKGDAGLPGATGPSGANGASFSATARTECQTVQNDTTLAYQAVRFADGSLFVSCRAASFDRQDSSSMIHLAGSIGATSGICFVTHDTSAPANRGQWTFRLSPLQVSYEDQLSPNNGYTYAFTAINCP